MDATNNNIAPQEPQKYGNRYRVVGYLPPLYNRLFNNYVAFNEESESSCLTTIVKKFFDGLPIQEREKLLKFSKNSY